MDCVGSVNSLSLQDASEAGEGPIERLPEEVLCWVFHFLSDEDMRQAEVVCRFWNQVANSMISRFGMFLSERQIEGLSEVQKMQLSTIGACPGAKLRIIRVLSKVEFGVLGKLFLASMNRAKFLSIVFNRSLLEKLIVISNAIPANDKDWPFYEITSGLAAIGEHGRALAIANQISDKSYYKTHALGVIAQQLAEKGMQDRSLAMIEDLQAIADTRQNKYEQSWGHNKILKQLGAMIDSVLALITTTRPSKYVQSLGLCEIAGYLVRMGDKEAALAEIDKALKIADTMPNQKDQSVVRCEIAMLLAAMGDIERAIHIETTILNIGQKSRALTHIAKQLAGKGEIPRALQIANGASDGFPNPLALSGIAKQLAEKGKKDEVLPIIESIRAFTNESFSQTVRAESFAEIADILIRVGENERAREAIEEALVIANTIDNPFEKSRVLYKIASPLAAMGEIERALVIEDTIPRESYKIKALLAIAFGE